MDDPVPAVPQGEDDGSCRRLIALATGSPSFMHLLLAARTLGLAHWCIGAGAVRNLVWDALHERRAPARLDDVDLAFFDPGDTSTARDARLVERLHAIDPAIAWDVTNQAGVHRWFEGLFGHAVEPLHSLDEAVASWPEYATAVGVTLQADDTVRVIAPHGLDDLFDIVIRRNPARVSVETYRKRIVQKRYAERWPKVRIVPC